MTEKKKALLEVVKASRIEVGDRVKVVCKVPSYHLGWDHVWCVDKDTAIGKVGIVTYINRCGCIEVDGLGLTGNRAMFPIYSLQVVEKKPKTYDIVIDGKKTEISYKSYEELKKVFNS